MERQLGDSASKGALGASPGTWIHPRDLCKGGSGKPILVYLFFYFLRRGLCLKLELTNLARVTGQQAPGPLRLCLSSAGV